MGDYSHTKIQNLRKRSVSWLWSVMETLKPGFWNWIFTLVVSQQSKIRLMSVLLRNIGVCNVVIENNITVGEFRSSPEKKSEKSLRLFVEKRAQLLINIYSSYKIEGFKAAFLILSLLLVRILKPEVNASDMENKVHGVLNKVKLLNYEFRAKVRIYKLWEKFFIPNWTIPERNKFKKSYLLD